MDIRLATKILSRGGFLLGVLSVISCFFPQWLFYGMMCSILGTISSVMVIFVRTKYAAPTKWNHISVISIVLCSAPVIYIGVLLFILKQ